MVLPTLSDERLSSLPLSRPGLHTLRVPAPVELGLPENVQRIRVFVPSTPPPPDGYAVLLVADGQNLFDADHADDRERGLADELLVSSLRLAPWGVDTAVEVLVAEGLIPPLLVVGVDHARDDRLDSYAPWPDERVSVDPRGEATAAFWLGRILPLVREKWPTRDGAPWTCVAGSSMGGLFALYLAARHPETIGRVAAFSPSAMIGEAERRWDAAWSRHPRTFQKVYLDAGAHERFRTEEVILDYAEAAKELFLHLRYRGYGPHELRLVLDPHGEHNESSWRHRFPGALEWLFG
jgi:predicted alpha/beta superfamily hydrolase